MMPGQSREPIGIAIWSYDLADLGVKESAVSARIATFLSIRCQFLYKEC
jgi:hypothetical protein